jgi:myo-inositol-hexaphosphate 3-phosphohydrolase
VQDGSNAGGRNQNFKMFSWGEIAGERLIIDRLWDARKRGD